MGQLLLETTLSFSVYPTGKIFPSGTGRILPLLTPAAVTAMLPVDAVEHASMRTFAVAAAASIVFFLVTVRIFRRGLRRYQSVSLVSVGR